MGSLAGRRVCSSIVLPHHRHMHPLTWNLHSALLPCRPGRRAGLHWGAWAAGHCAGGAVPLSCRAAAEQLPLLLGSRKGVLIPACRLACLPAGRPLPPELPCPTEPRCRCPGAPARFRPRGGTRRRYRRHGTWWKASWCAGQGVLVESSGGMVWDWVGALDGGAADPVGGCHHWCGHWCGQGARGRAS